ncbi:MAG: dockerin type I repeat-containing protein, partial [Candidatus Zixiibacteriota bacterium]
LVTSWNGDLNSFLACVDSQISWFNNYVVPGACCDTTTGDCSIKSAATCTGPNEEFRGAWTDCGPPNPCALTCCNTDGIRGDVDMSGSLNVSDVTYLVAFLKGLGPAPTCDDEADVDASGSINVSDVTYLVAYLKGIGPAPPACP